MLQRYDILPTPPNISPSSFSLDGLVSQLVLAGFTSEEASEGARRAYSTTAEDSDITYSMEEGIEHAEFTPDELFEVSRSLAWIDVCKLPGPAAE